jgi:hypothetical protein
LEGFSLQYFSTTAEVSQYSNLTIPSIQFDQPAHSQTSIADPPIKGKVTEQK